MGFPVPGDAIEQSLDLNRYLVQTPAATFFMRVQGDLVADAAVQPGDLLIVDRSRTVQARSLIVGIIDGQLVVLRVAQVGQTLLPEGPFDHPGIDSLAVWGVVTNIIRAV